MTRRSPWGGVRRLRSGRYQARYRIDDVNHVAPRTFRTKREAHAFRTQELYEGLPQLHVLLRYRIWLQPDDIRRDCPWRPASATGNVQPYGCR